MARLTKNQAESLWIDLRDNFLDAEKNIKTIIATKAWEPLGYKTFAEAWLFKLGDVTLAAEVRRHVVYELLSENVGLGYIAEAVKGITPKSADFLNRQRKNGIPADQASTVVREHDRKLPSKPDTLHIKVGRTTLAEYQRIAGPLPQSVEEISQEAIAARFAELVKQPKSRRIT